MCITLAMTWFAMGAMAQGTRDFDHLKTGFQLSGAHAATKCESCHVRGVFKGTPRDCVTCHTSGSLLARNNVIKTQKHFPTTAACESCHSVQTFTGANYAIDRSRDLDF
jgi:hypothetical protein